MKKDLKKFIKYYVLEVLVEELPKNECVEHAEHAKIFIEYYNEEPVKKQRADFKWRFYLTEDEAIERGLKL
jgi:hypothetical protein